jgi:hypothetical protein
MITFSEDQSPVKFYVYEYSWRMKAPRIGHTYPFIRQTRPLMRISFLRWDFLLEMKWSFEYSSAQADSHLVPI